VSREGLRISITKHASERARERLGLSDEDVRRDVRGALKQGRIAQERPAFLKGDDWTLPRIKGRANVFCWNAAEDRGYVIRDYEDGGGVVVITALVEADTAVSRAFAEAAAA
jgi:hypothetical protein